MSNIGRTLYGYCNGFFGRDSYGEKRIEAEGHDWIAVRTKGGIELAYFDDAWLADKQALIDEWAKEPDDDDW